MRICISKSHSEYYKFIAPNILLYENESLKIICNFIWNFYSTYLLRLHLAALSKKKLILTFQKPAINYCKEIPVVIVRYLPTIDGFNIDVSQVNEYWSLGEYTLDELKSRIDQFNKRVKFFVRRRKSIPWI